MIKVYTTGDRLVDGKCIVLELDNYEQVKYFSLEEAEYLAAVLILNIEFAKKKQEEK